MKKKIIMLSSLALGIAYCHAQQPIWEWTKCVGGQDVEGWCGAPDLDGNIYVAGHFDGPSVNFDNTTLLNQGWYDVFVTKYNELGQVMWAKSMGGIDYDATTCMTTDKDNNVIVAGYFQSPSIVVGPYTLYNYGYCSTFLLKYDPDGNLLWATYSKCGNNLSSNNRGYGVAADGYGDIYLTGYFLGEDLVFGNDTLVGTEGSDAFLVKYDPAGNEVWAHTILGNGYTTIAYGVDADKSNNIYIVGEFNSALCAFENDTVLVNLGVDNSSDIFLAKYNSQGNLLWARRDGSNSESAFAVSTDNNNNVIITGNFGGPSVIGNTTLYSYGYSDMFISKYDSSGNPLWSKSGGGNGIDLGYSLCVDNSDNIYLSGGAPFYSNGWLTFDSVIINTGLGDELFIVKYNASGNLQDAFALRSGGDDNNSVTADHFGNVYLVGDYMTDDPFVIGEDTLLCEGGENLFIGKFNYGFHESVNEINSLSEINIYPNPANDILQSSISSQGCYMMKIENENGSTLATYKQQLHQKELHIDVKDFAQGIYFLKFYFEDGVVVKKFVKQ